jgi:tRNA-splicing ligase RtcB
MEMRLIDGTIAVFGEADEKTMKQIRTCAKTADKVALMPDNHLGYGVPIGGIVAYCNESRTDVLCNSRV